MEIILHRRNAISDLVSTDRGYGVEIDLRLHNNQLIVQHDPFVGGDLFQEWIKYYKHRRLILNVKEEGIEESILDILSKNNIKNFFFLDQSFPNLIKYSKRGESRLALRLSEYEPIEIALRLTRAVQWIWLDSFHELKLIPSDLELLGNLGYKICLVSPELHGREPFAEVVRARESILSNSINIEAVCTKLPDLWA